MFSTSPEGTAVFGEMGTLLLQLYVVSLFFQFVYGVYLCLNPIQINGLIQRNPREKSNCSVVYAAKNLTLNLKPPRSLKDPCEGVGVSKAWLIGNHFRLPETTAPNSKQVSALPSMFPWNLMFRDLGRLC